MKDLGRKTRVHGMRGTRFYKIWENMKSRCAGTATSSKYYIGIKCHWSLFIDFQRDMYQSYQKHVATYGENETEIDRIDSKGDYTKENCRWVTQIEQAMNRSVTTTKMVGDTIQRRCSGCLEVKPLPSFGRNRTRRLGYDFLCKNCKNILSRQRYANA